MALASIFLVTMVLSNTAFAGKPQRYYLELGEVSAAPELPVETVAKTRTLFAELLSGREDVSPVRAAGVAAFSLKLKVAGERKLGPNPDKPGQLLTIGFNVMLVGTKLPGDVLAMSGQGISTVVTEVGATVRPKEEELATDDALRDALSQALNDALTRLARPVQPPAKTKKKGR